MKFSVFTLEYHMKTKRQKEKEQWFCFFFNLDFFHHPLKLSWPDVREWSHRVMKGAVCSTTGQPGTKPFISTSIFRSQTPPPISVHCNPFIWITRAMRLMDKQSSHLQTSFFGTYRVVCPLGDIQWRKRNVWKKIQKCEPDGNGSMVSWERNPLLP